MHLNGGHGASRVRSAEQSTALPLCGHRKDRTMFAQYEDFQKFGKQGMDAALKNFGTMSKGFQAIAVEVADFSKKQFEASSAAFEKLVGGKTLDKAVEVQEIGR